MPTKRSVLGPTLRLGDLTFMERYAFLGSWWRPGSACRRDTRWSSWREYFDAYAAVRSELLGERQHHWPPFAELAFPLFQADAARFDPDEAAEAYYAARNAYAIKRGSAGARFDGEAVS